MIGVIEEDKIIDGDDPIKEGNYFIFISKTNYIDMLVHRITTTEYITYKLKDERKKVYTVVSLSPFKFKTIYE